MKVERPTEVAIRTYRYLRMGMVAAIALIGVSVALEMLDSSGCFQQSFSAYYYTPARGVFAGALIAIALGMIAVLGSTPVEDAFLNLGGLLAPIVAFVPSGSANYCSVVGPGGKELDKLQSTDTAQQRADGVVANARAAIDNNVAALLWVVGFALVGLVFVSFLRKERGFKAKLPREGVYILSYLLASLFWVVAFVSFWQFTDKFYAWAHFTAAVLLFVCIFIVVLNNAYDRAVKRGPGPGRSRKLPALPRRLSTALWDRYGMLALAMVLSVIFVVTVGPSQFPDHRTLVIEALLIGLFGIFWVLQTIELRRHGLRVRTATSEETQADTTSSPADGG